MAEHTDSGIETELKANKQKLEDIKSEMEKKNKQQQELQKYVTELEKANGDAKQAYGSYEKVFLEKESMDKFAAKGSIDEDVKDYLSQIEEVRSRLEQAAGAPSKRIKELETKHSSLNTELATAKGRVDRAQKSYDELKGKQKELDTSLKKIRDLKTLIERDQQDSKPAAYHALVRMREELQSLALEDPDKFSHDFEDAGKALADANGEVRSKSAELEKLAAELEGLRKRESKYQDDVLAELRKLKLQPPAKQSQQQTKHPAQSKQSAQATAGTTS
jgi:chromosome segregation ATPase